MPTKNHIRHLLAAESAEVRKRRLSQGIEQPVTADLYNSELVGVALSGGGIRSSTLALGVLQSLAKHNILPRVDYLSTVSGGGFIGGCVSSALNDELARSDSENFPLRENIGSAESNQLTQLRNSAKYLAPLGFFEKLRIPALLVRGMLINLVLLMPMIVLAVFMTEVWAEYLGLGDEALIYVVRGATVAFFVLALIPPYLSYTFAQRLNWRDRQRYEYLFIFFLVVALAALLLYPLTLMVESAIDISWGRFIYVTIDELSWATDSAMFWLILLVAITILVAAGKASENLASLRNRLLLYLAALVGPALIFITYVVMCVIQIDSPYIHLSAGYKLPREDLALLKHDGHLSEKLIERMRSEDQPIGNTAPPSEIQLKQIDDNNWEVRDAWHTYALQIKHGQLIVHNDWLISTLNRSEMAESIKSLLKGRGLNLEGKVRVTTVEENRSWTFQHDNQGTTITARSGERVLISPQPVDLLDPGDPWLYGLAIGLLILNFVFVNVNFTSLHGFYRDQLTRGFLFRQGSRSGSDSGRRVKLSSLNTPGSAAPYHLINATLNLQGSDDINLRGRGADFYLISRHFIGSDRTGYTATEDMEAVDPHMDLGTAMAISGAAASPNAGSLSVKPLVFILTMLNLRLGYWAPNPSVVESSSSLGRYLLRRGAGPKYVFREAIGNLTDKTRYVNLSDGGHLENTGIYQLLRRRCRVIICSDGEYDPQMQSGGLVKLIRLAAIDLGIHIDIDIDVFQRDQSTGLSDSHFAVGRIEYGNGMTGTLYYLKASLTGDENPYIKEYHQRNPEFPHEATAEQFFSEDQFESYRALGMHMADQMMLAEKEITELCRQA